MNVEWNKNITQCTGNISNVKPLSRHNVSRGHSETSNCAHELFRGHSHCVNCRRFRCRRLGMSPFWPYHSVAVLAVAIIVCRRFHGTANPRPLVRKSDALPPSYRANLPEIRRCIPLTAHTRFMCQKRVKIFRQALKSLWRKKLTTLLSKPFVPRLVQPT